MMSANELLTEAMKLPSLERRAFAEQLWQSLDQDNSDSSLEASPDTEFLEDPEFIEELKRRVSAVQSGNYESLSLSESKALASKALAEITR